MKKHIVSVITPCTLQVRAIAMHVFLTVPQFTFPLLTCYQPTAKAEYFTMRAPAIIHQRTILLGLFALVLSCPYAIPVPWLAISRWFGVVSAENPGFLPSPVENQVWYIVFGSAVLFISAALLSLRNALPRSDRLITGAAIAWFTITGARALFSPGIQWSYSEMFLQASFFLLFLTAIFSSPRHADIYRFQILAAVITIPLAILALAQNAGHDPLPYSPTMPGSLDVVHGKHLVASTFGHPNYMGSYMAPLVILSVALALSRASMVLRGSAAASALLAVLALIVGGTRGPLLALMGGLGVYLILIPRRHIPWRRTLINLAITACLLVGIALIFPALRPNFELAERLFGSKEIASRAFYWRIGLNAFLDNPLFGIGPGQFDRLFWQYILDNPETRPGGRWHFVLANVIRGVRPGQMHNDHLQVLVETGLFGAVAWLALWGAIARRAIGLQNAKSVPVEMHQPDALPPTNGSATPLNAAIAGALTVFCIDALFSFPFHLPTSGALFWILLGLWSNVGRASLSITTDH